MSVTSSMAQKTPEARAWRSVSRTSQRTANRTSGRVMGTPAGEDSSGRRQRRTPPPEAGRGWLGYCTAGGRAPLLNQRHLDARLHDALHRLADFVAAGVG